MTSLVLQATRRDPKMNTKELRASGQLPCVLYGHKTKNTALSIDPRVFYKVYVAGGESTILDLELEGKTTQVLIHELQYDPMTNVFTHVDFFAPDMTKEVTTNVPIRITGESLAMKEQGGILVRNRDHVTVRCLPKNLPHDIAIDLSPLINLHDSLTVAALPIPANVTIVDDPSTIIVSVAPPRKEEVAPVAAEGVEGAVASEAAAAEGETAKEGAEKAEGGEKKDAGKKEGGDKKKEKK